MDKSKDWANDILRYSIAVLRGERIVSRPEGRLHIALIMKERLEDAGFWWQARILEFHMHRFLQRQEALTLSERREELHHVRIK